MSVSATTFYDKCLVELSARGFDVLNADAGDWSKKFLEALTDSFTNIWLISITIPGAGPNPPGTAPHTHLIAPGFFTPVTLAATVTSACIAAGFAPAYAWESLRDAWSDALATNMAVVLTDVQDGNTTHTHTWLGISGSVLKAAVVAYLTANHPELDLSNPASKLGDYIEAISEALADTILSNGETSLPIVAGITHTHNLA